MSEPDSLPEALSAWMVAAGLNGAQLAATLGINPSAVSHWLSGRNTPAPDRCADLAAALKLSRSEALALMRLSGVQVPAAVLDVPTAPVGA